MKKPDYFSLYRSICATILKRDGLPVWAEIAEEARKQAPLLRFKARKAA
jgi:hypothetical protein